MSDKWGIHRLSDMIGTDDNSSTAFGLEGYFRAVPLPYCGARLRAAWYVLTGKAYAVRWPEPGELESALSTGGIDRKASPMWRVREPE